jgi:hypothetical protein
MLSPEPNKACKDAVLVSSTKRHVQLSKEAIVLNLFGKGVCRCFSEMFPVYIELCPTALHDVEACISQNTDNFFPGTYPSTSEIYKIVLLGLFTPSYN